MLLNCFQNESIHSLTKVYGIKYIYLQSSYFL